MASNNIEERVINQVKKLNEGILDSIARMFMARKVKQHYKKAFQLLDKFESSDYKQELENLLIFLQNRDH